jgi:hypothetical protein
MKTSLAELVDDMRDFVIQMEYYRPGEDCPPVCPLCNDREADYRALTDDEVNSAWNQAKTKMEWLRLGDECLQELGCRPNWRENWIVNHQGFTTIRGQSRDIY